MRFDPVFLLAALALAACSKKPAAPVVEAPVRLEASLGRSELTATDTTTATFRLRNQSADTVRLKFTSGCQIVPNIVENVSGDPVVLGTVCSTALTELVLAPGTESSMSLVVGGSQAPEIGDRTRLPAGEYRIFGTVSAGTVELRSEDVRLTVR